MGGNALRLASKPTETSRISLDVYDVIKLLLFSLLSAYSPQVPPELPDKDDHGDIDIVCVVLSPETFVDEICTLFKTDHDHIYINGDTVSVPFEHNGQVYQVDLNRVTSLEKQKMMLVYKSYGIIGAILGRMANWYKLHYGGQGLFLEILVKNKPTIQFILSSEPVDIFEFLHLDYRYFVEVVPTLTKDTYYNIFEWVTMSPLFSPSIYAHFVGKKYDELRPFYRDFLDYIRRPKYTDREKKEFVSLADDAVNYFNKREHHQSIMDNLKAQEEIEKARKEKFTTKNLIDAFMSIKKYQLKGAEIGKLLKSFEEFCTKNLSTFDEYLDRSDKATLKEMVEDFVNVYHLSI